MKLRGQGPHEAQTLLRIAVVGPCSAGKSTLLPSLIAAGYEARQPAQEHSFAPDMWRRLVKPDVLIYLDVSYPAARKRRPYIDGGPQRIEIQHLRLQHAREHCDYYLDTSELTPRQVRQAVLGFIEDWKGKRPLD